MGLAGGNFPGGNLVSCGSTVGLSLLPQQGRCGRGKGQEGGLGRQAADDSLCVALGDRILTVVIVNIPAQYAM
jgi:hypothetical protein